MARTAAGVVLGRWRRIADDDVQVVLVGFNANIDATALRQARDAMQNRILEQRLQQQAWIGTGSPRRTPSSSSAALAS